VLRSARRDLPAAVALANRIVPFPLAARLAGMENVPEPRLSGSRAYCPFGEFSHPDSGVEKALRVYPDHGYCFAESLYLSPVRIYAMMNELPEDESAAQLLDHVGYHPGSWQQRWEQAASPKAEPDRDALSAALQVWLGTQCPGWGNLQYDSRVSSVLAACLGLLPRVNTEEDCGIWLARSKQTMTDIIRRVTWREVQGG
jgi:hypothetical protein